MGKKVALLRGINVGGRTRLAMADLKRICSGLGWQAVTTYINSGNLLFESTADGLALETELEAALAAELGVSFPVIVRSAAEWPALVAGNPFPEAAEAEPNRLMLCLAKQPFAAGSKAALQEKARDGERIAVRGEALWIHYPSGAGTSRLSPAMIDRAAGSPVTARNHRTAMKLLELLGP